VTGGLVEGAFRPEFPGATERDDVILPAVPLAFGPRVQVGVAACNSSTVPLTADFEGFRIKKD
jgi:hypothetical protein